MKKTVFALCMGICSLIYDQGIAQSFPYKINGKLTNMSPMPTKLYLISTVKGTLKKDTDMVSVINGAYVFQGELKVDEAIMVSVSPEPVITPTNAYTLFLDKGELDVISDGSLRKITATGSGETAQREYDAIIAGITKEKEQLEQLTKSEAYKTDQQLQADVLKRSRQLPSKGINDFLTFLKTYPEKRSAPYITYLFTVPLPVISGKALDTVLSRLPEHVKNDRLGYEIVHGRARMDSLNKVAQANRNKEAEKVAIGSLAPEFTQSDSHDKAVSLSSFKGKYVLVDFWASWCAPCRAENPNVVKAYNKYKDNGFTVLGVSLDAQASRAAWIKAIASDGLAWTQVSDLKGWKNEAAVAYGVTAIPQNFLIDPKGNVIGKNLRGEELNAKLASIFK